MFLFKCPLLKIPTIDRFYALNTLLFIFLIFAFPIQAKTTLTEAYLIEKVLQQESVKNWIEGRINEAQSNIDEVSHWDNPTFSYALELPSNSNHNAIENSYMIFQKIDLSGRRGLQQSAAKLNLKSVESATQYRLLLFKEEARLRFFDALYRQQRTKVIDAWTEHISQMEQIIALREKSGDVSGYDSRRIQREYASAVTRQQAEKALLQQSWERLIALWDKNSSDDMKQEVSGELLPATPAPLQKLLSRLDQNPELRSLDQQRSALNLNTKAAERWKIPKFNLGVGVRTFNAPTYSDVGALVSSDVPLPLWSQNNAERLRFRSQTQKVESEYKLAHQKAEGEIRSLWHELNGLLKAVKIFKQQGQTVSDELIDIAVVSYYNGETSILELLDAYREHRSFDLEMLELEYKARKASIELDRLTIGMKS